jgi:UDP-2-acetamido-3-amino-2,3-dideoxy-glucuronate N-acetyltransferase
MIIKKGKNVVIEEPCIVGQGTVIGHGCVFRPNTVIGDRCKIGHLTVSEGNNKIGDRVTVHAQSHLMQGITIEDDVFVGPFFIGVNTKNIVHGRKHKHVLDRILIKRAARVGGGVRVLCGVTIGENAVVGFGSLVLKDVPDREMWAGNPAVKIGDVPEEEWL